jgi:uncharacterized protein with HEPN domain
MRRDPRAFLWDAQKAAEAIADFTRGKMYDAFAQDLLLRSAVERQFEIVGEALGQLAKHQPDMAARIPDLPRIIAFRNILIHGYATIDRELVRRVIHENLPELRVILAELLAEGQG